MWLNNVLRPSFSVLDLALSYPLIISEISTAMRSLLLDLETCGLGRDLTLALILLAMQIHHWTCISLALWFRVDTCVIGVVVMSLSLCLYLQLLHYSSWLRGVSSAVASAASLDSSNGWRVVQDAFQMSANRRHSDSWTVPKVLRLQAVDHAARTFTPASQTVSDVQTDVASYYLHESWTRARLTGIWLL